MCLNLIGTKTLYFLRDDYLDNKNKIVGDLITRISGGGEIGIRKDILEFLKDTLFVTPFKANTKNVYVKRKVPFEILNSKAEW